MTMPNYVFEARLLFIFSYWPSGFSLHVIVSNIMNSIIYSK